MPSDTNDETIAAEDVEQGAVKTQGTQGEEESGKEQEPKADAQAAKTAEEAQKADAEAKEEPGQSAERKAQSRDLNHLYAEQRRSAESKGGDPRQGPKEEAVSGFNEGFKEAIGGVNPYTGEKIEDDSDIETVRIMAEAKRRGLDPIADFYKAEKMIKAERQSKEKEQADYVEKDKADFAKEYPTVNLLDVLNDPEFRKRNEDLVGRVPMSKLYKQYSEYKGEVERLRKENESLKVRGARSEATPGPMSGNATPSKYYTRDELAKLTEEEIRSNWQKVEDSVARLDAGKE